MEAQVEARVVSEGLSDGSKGHSVIISLQGQRWTNEKGTHLCIDCIDEKRATECAAAINEAIRKAVP